MPSVNDTRKVIQHIGPSFLSDVIPSLRQQGRIHSEKDNIVRKEHEAVNSVVFYPAPLVIPSHFSSDTNNTNDNIFTDVLKRFENSRVAYFRN